MESSNYIEYGGDPLKNVQEIKGEDNILLQMDMKMYNERGRHHFIIVKEEPDISGSLDDGKSNISYIFNFDPIQNNTKISVNTTTCGNDNQEKLQVGSDEIVHNNSNKVSESESDYLMDNSNKSHILEGMNDESVQKLGSNPLNMIDKTIMAKVLSHNKKSVFQCSNCKEIFNDKTYFINHQNVQSLCYNCSSNFCLESEVESNKNIFNQDMREVSNRDSSSKCQCNSEMSSYISELKDHDCTCNKHTFKCEKCKRIFNDENDLGKHAQGENCCRGDGFTCDTCKKMFYDFNSLKEHIMMHLVKQCDKSSQCFISGSVAREDDCRVVRSDSYNLKEGTVQMQGESMDFLLENEVMNNGCLSLNNPSHNRHQFPNGKSDDDNEKGTGENDLGQRCYGVQADMCEGTQKATAEPKMGKQSDSGERKLTDDNDKKNKYECDACGEKFSRLAKLRIHIVNSHQRVDDYECQKCHLKFSTQSECSRHEARDCNVEPSHRCKICGKYFSKRDYLKKHEYIHSNTLYKCKFCYCAFMKEKSYRKHMERMNCSKSARKIRLAEFDYKTCRICGQSFDEEEMLIKHFETGHPGENPHRCFCCESSLPSFNDLQQHIHLHNIQKFTCNLCGKPYTSQEGFRKHRLKHKGAEFKCRFCESEFLNESRFKFHVKICKKNPDGLYPDSQDKSKQGKKDKKPKQSRQLHWESRIIMKHLRGDPNSGSDKQSGRCRSQKDNYFASTFFDEPDTDSSDGNVRGWFDDYYKTEEDDFAFGLKKDGDAVKSSAEAINRDCQSLRGGKKRSESRANEKPNSSAIISSDRSNEAVEDNSEPSSDESSSDSSDENVSDDLDPSIDYNPKKCRICVVTFSQEYELLHHFIKVHPNQRAHKCPNCEAESPLFAQLKEHMKTHGIGMGIYNCDNCSKKFKSEKKMKSHNIRCKGTTLSDAADGANGRCRPDDGDHCKRCGKKFQTRCGYRRHKQVCKGKRRSNRENRKAGEPSGECEGTENADESVRGKVDGGGGGGGSGLNRGNAETDPPAKPVPREAAGNCRDAFAEEPPADSFPCRLCDKKFQYERGIVMHFKSHHPGQKPLVCHICSMHLADKLKEHLKTHGIGEEFICELCGKRFNQKFLSKIHEMWHQGVEYKCNNCKQKFLNKEKMDKHISEGRCSNRQSLMRLPCDICGKSYRSKFGLSKHYITHTPKELRPVKNRMNCEFCGKWFENNNGLQRHRRIHTGERPFCCRFCSKAFAQEGNCKAHERIHTGESRPRKKKNLPTEPVSYPSHVNPSVYNADGNAVVQLH